MAQTQEYNLRQDICSGRSDIKLQTFKEGLTLAIEIAREGREGRKIGTSLLLTLFLSPLYLT